MNTPENVKLKYLYRDAANYKSWGEVIFKNPDKLDIHEVEERLRRSLDSGEFFVAAQVCIPEIFLFLQDRVTDYDHCYHEFYSVEGTADQHTDSFDRSIKYFLEQIERIGRDNWQLVM